MERSGQRAPSWWRTLLVGFALWLASVLVTAVTQNFNMIPTVVLLGSFLVPVSAVLWYLDHYSGETLSDRDVLNGFLVGGVLGVLGASLLESWLLTGGALVYVGVGLIEEGVKLLALLLVAWRLPHYSARDGVVLGAAVGFGFAALESSGYALTALFASAGQGALSLSSLVESELVRGVLAPVGHGLWTAILGGALFAAARGGRFRFSRGLVLTYIAVAALHAIWDSMRGIALLITGLLSSAPIQVLATPQGPVLEPSPAQVHLFTAAEIAGFALVSVLGLAWLRSLWRRTRRAPPAVPA